MFLASMQSTAGAIPAGVVFIILVIGIGLIMAGRRQARRDQARRKRS